MDKQMWAEKLSKYTRMLQEQGSDSQTIIHPATVETVPWAVYKCRYGCRNYGTRLICPPETPSYQETRAILDCFQVGILFRTERGDDIDTVRAVLGELFRDGYYKALGFGCCSCCFDQAPEKALPSMEACGVDVIATVRNNGYELNMGTTDQPPAYFGLILIE